MTTDIQNVPQEDLARICFELDIVDGWPPVGAETLLAAQRADDEFIIHNVPWFVFGVAIGYVVRANRSDPRSPLFFREVIEPSDHQVVRLICLPDGPLRGDVEKAAEQFAAIGVYGEGFERMLALDVTPTAPLEQLIDLLLRGEADGSWGFETACTNQAWDDAYPD